MSLSDHLNGGRPWDLDRTRGGFLALAPRQDKDTGKGGFASGTADVLWRHTELVREFAPDALVVVSSDAVYALDYEQVVGGHLASDADVTMVTTRVDPQDASRYGVVLVGDGRVTDYAYEPEQPQSDLVTNESVLLHGAVVRRRPPAREGRVTTTPGRTPVRAHYPARTVRDTPCWRTVRAG